MNINKQISEKILIIGPDYRHRGGIEAVLANYRNYFEKFNFVPTHREGSALCKMYVFFIGLIRIMYTLLRNRKIKIVHIHSSKNGSFYRKFICFVISKYLFRKRVINHVHSGAYHLFYAKSKPAIKKMIRKFVNDADTLICLSESWKQFFDENFNPVKIEILPNMIDYPVHKEKKEDTKKIKFLFLGFINNNKGIFDVIEVIKNNVDFFSEHIELIIGGDGENDKLQNLIKNYQIGNIVKFVGWIQNKAKIQYLQNTDVFILTSYSEGLPVSILEAMSYRKPIISTPVGGIPEVVKNDENGFLITPGNWEQIEKSMKYFVDHPHDIEKFGHVSAKMAEKYLPDNVILHLNKIYSDILSE